MGRTVSRPLLIQGTQALWHDRIRDQDHQQRARIHAKHPTLGLEWQCPAILGFHVSLEHTRRIRYWRDLTMQLSYGGKLQRIERQIHHYGSALNAQVLLAAFRDDPTDSYLLRTGYAGATGALAGINEDGFPGAAFHSFPDTLKWDGITGDYGGGFIGMALSSGTYVAQEEDIGLVTYGGILSSDGDVVAVKPRGPVRRRVFIGPLSVLISVDAGEVQEFVYNVAESTISVTLGQQDGSPVAAQAAIWVESMAGGSWCATADDISEGRGGWVLPLATDAATTFQLGTSC